MLLHCRTVATLAGAEPLSQAPIEGPADHLVEAGLGVETIAGAAVAAHAQP